MLLNITREPWLALPPRSEIIARLRHIPVSIHSALTYELKFQSDVTNAAVSQRRHGQLDNKPWEEEPALPVSGSGVGF